MCALTSKLDMKFIFRLENLDIERAVWSKVLCGPGPQNSLMVLWERSIFYFTHLSSDPFRKCNLHLFGLYRLFLTVSVHLENSNIVLLSVLVLNYK